jgi:hypothetical protein
MLYVTNKMPWRSKGPCKNLSRKKSKHEGTKRSDIKHKVQNGQILRHISNILLYQICYCHNLSFGLATKARVCKGASQE